jgi:inner membrane protein
MIQSQVSERNWTHQSVIQEISNSWGAEQKVAGPFLRVPYQTTKTIQVWDSNLEQYRNEDRVSNHVLVLTPDNAFYDGRVEVSERQRGIYKAPVYNSEMTLQGVFDLSQVKTLDAAIGTPELIILMSDLSGILSIPTLKVGEQSHPFVEGGLGKMKGIRVKIPNWNQFAQFEVQLALKGSQRISVYPMATNNDVRLTSNWPHPSFNGQFLPESYDIGAEGFSARWRTTSLSSNASQLLNQCVNGNCNDILTSSYGVTFFEPVSHYTLSDRASKYALLLILVTFALFFILETVSTATVHPVQYFLVGLSLTIFNLLLVAMTEHIAFGVSYLISTVACVGLLLLYAKPILRNAHWLFGFGCILLTIYGLMFIILKSEDFAFLMGAIFLFLILAVLMLSTRKVDWYQIAPANRAVPDAD